MFNDIFGYYADIRIKQVTRCDGACWQTINNRLSHYYLDEGNNINTSPAKTISYISHNLTNLMKLREFLCEILNHPSI